MLCGVFTAFPDSLWNLGYFLYIVLSCCRISRMVNYIQGHADYEVTDLFMRNLEQTIKKNPPYWLWTHDRWMRTREEIGLV